MTESLLAEMAQRLAEIEARTRRIEDYARETRGLVGPWAASLADGKLLVHTLHRMLLIVDSTDLILTPQLVCYRQWEPELTELFWNSCRSDTVFVDVGANIGYFSVLAGTRIHAGGKGRVIAVEPNPDCVALLERNLVINWSMAEVTLHRVAAGARKGAVWLTYPDNRAANAHISADDAPADGERGFRATVAPIDDLVPDGLKVDILKIDVEGYEISVLQGANRVIAQSPDIRIVMEWSPKQMRAAGVPVDAVRDSLAHLGLAARRLPSSRTLDGLTLENAPLIPFEELSRMAYDNILLTRL